MSRSGLVALLLLAAASGCGASTNRASPPTTAVSTIASRQSTAQTTTTPAGPGALQAEANAAAAGDIPDNQVFLIFRNAPTGYSMKYPEGWARQGSSGAVTFRDKNNIVRVVVTNAPTPSKASVAAEIATLRHAHLRQAPRAMTIAGKPAIKVVYSTASAPNTVTGKRVNLVVDRYYLWKGRRRAVVDLGTPAGVDNVDAYRLMIDSFRWR